MRDFKEFFNDFFRVHVFFELNLYKLHHITSDEKVGISIAPLDQLHEPLKGIEKLIINSANRDLKLDSFHMASEIVGEGSY